MSIVVSIVLEELQNPEIRRDAIVLLARGIMELIIENDSLRMKLENAQEELARRQRKDDQFIKESHALAGELVNKALEMGMKQEGDTATIRETGRKIFLDMWPTMTKTENA